MVWMLITAWAVFFVAAYLLAPKPPRAGEVQHLNMFEETSVPKPRRAEDDLEVLRPGVIIKK